MKNADPIIQLEVYNLINILVLFLKTNRGTNLNLFTITLDLYIFS